MTFILETFAIANKPTLNAEELIMTTGKKYIKFALGITILYYLACNYCQVVSATLDSINETKELSADEMIAILDLIETKARENYKKIQSWSGEINESALYHHIGDKAKELAERYSRINETTPDTITQRIEKESIFILDENDQSYFVESFQKVPGKYYDAKTGKELWHIESRPYRTIIISRPDYFVEIKPQSYDPSSGSIIQNVIKKNPIKKALAGFYKSGDPRRPFMSGGRFIWDNIIAQINHADKTISIELDEYKQMIYEYQQNGDLFYKVITPMSRLPEPSNLNDLFVVTKIFAEKYDYNIISYEVTTGSGTPLLRHSLEYEVIEGIHLPKSITEKQYRSSGETAYEKYSVYKSQNLNTPISSDQFDYEKIDFFDGDMLIDAIANKEFRYESKTKTFQAITEEK